jgi:hypothetical protein
MLRRLLPAGNGRLDYAAPQRQEVGQSAKGVEQQWHVLVFDSFERTARPTLAAEHEPNALTVFEQCKWRTIWSNGSAVKVFDGILVNIRQHLYRLETRTVSHTKDHYCKEGLVCCKYSLDTLEARPFLKGRRRVLWRPRSAKFTDFCNCQSFDEDDARAPKPSVHEKCSLTIRSICNDSISIDYVGEEYGMSNPTNEKSRNWQTFELTAAGLKKRALPKQLLAKAQQLHKAQALQNSLVAQYEMPQAAYILTPAQKGISVHFGLTVADDPGDSNLYCLSVDGVDMLPEHLTRARDTFVAQNPELIDWQNVEFYSVAPDHSAVVYIEDATLFWKNTTGFKRALGQISQLRGFQWIDTRMMPGSERYGLMAH